MFPFTPKLTRFLVAALRGGQVFARAEVFAENSREALALCGSIIGAADSYSIAVDLTDDRRG